MPTTTEMTHEKDANEGIETIVRRKSRTRSSERRNWYDRLMDCSMRLVSTSMTRYRMFVGPSCRNRDIVKCQRSTQCSAYTIVPNPLNYDLRRPGSIRLGLLDDATIVGDLDR
jgi:hypothetical protein